MKLMISFWWKDVRNQAGQTGYCRAKERQDGSTAGDQILNDRGKPEPPHG